jgi:hypothetical protein
MTPSPAPCGANQVFLLGGVLGESTVQRLRCVLDRVDPHACVEIDIERGALKIGTPVAADDVLDSLLRAGITVQAWAAELPVRDGYARRTRRPAPAVKIQGPRGSVVSLDES